jgi:ELWxxDGT repeat protein
MSSVSHKFSEEAPMVFDLCKTMMRRIFQDSVKGNNSFLRAHAKRGIFEPLESRRLLSSAGILKIEAVGDYAQEDFTAYQDAVYFTTDPEGDLWRTDNTQDGTVLVKDFDVSNGYDMDLAVINDQLMIRRGSELWVSDGTGVGTWELTAQIPNVGQLEAFTPFGDKLFFGVQDVNTGYWQYWVTDGTPTQTFSITAPTNLENRVTNTLAFGNSILFDYGDPVHGKELWINDGTPGSILLKDIGPESFGSFDITFNSFFATDGTKAFFTAHTPQLGHELWCTDGTPEGTRLIKDIASGTYSSSPSHTAMLNGVAYFSADVDNDIELWRSDGTEAGTWKVTDPDNDEYGLKPQELVTAGSKIIFTAEKTENDREIWITDGTEMGTYMLHDVYPGSWSSSPTSLRASGEYVYFLANDGVSGQEVWRTDGYNLEPFEIRLGPEGAEARELTIVNDLLYLSAFDHNGTGWDIYVVGMTNSGLVPEVEIQGNGSTIDKFNIPNHMDGTDFTPTVVNQEGMTRTFTVRNDGSSALPLSNLVVPEGYSVTESLVAVLAPGGSDSFSVRLDAGVVGHKTGDISFDVGSTGEYSFGFNISGKVTNDDAKEFHLLALIYPEVDIPQRGSMPAASASMDQAAVDALVNAIPLELPTLINQLAGDQIQVRVHTVIVDRPLDELTWDGSNYQGAAESMVSEELDALAKPGWYDHVIVMHGLVGGVGPTAWWGGGPNRYGMSMASLCMFPNAAVLDNSANPFPGMIHEWIHGLEVQYFWLRQVPMGNDPEGGNLDLHDGDKFNYQYYTDGRPDGIAWYGDYLTDDIRNFHSDGQDSNLGLGPDAWQHDVPRLDNVYTPGSPLERPDATNETNAFLSDVYWASSSAGWGSVQRDFTVNGNPIQINGVQYGKGVGIHSYGEIVVNLRGRAERFQADVGVDDDVSSSEGSVIFKIYGDGRLLFESDVMTGADNAQQVDVDLIGIQKVRFIIEDAGDGGINDHGTWANAIFLPLKGDFVSEMRWASSSTGWEAIHLDKTMSRSDIRINGVYYGKGIGTHAHSEIVIPLNSQYASFNSYVGVPDDVDDAGSVVFEAYADGQLAFSSGVMTGADPAILAEFDIDNVNELKLVVSDAGDGTVADHAVWAEAYLLKSESQVYVYDYGDAPDASVGMGSGNYNTVSADSGPSHRVIAGIHLGASVDADDGTLQNVAADADDMDQTPPDDEDGLVNPVLDLTVGVGTQPTVDVTVTNTTGATATLYGWFDYNNDGVFNNATERAQIAVPNGTAAGVVTLIFPTVPIGYTGQTYARFRLSTDAAASDPIGTAADGEVEDYAVTIDNDVYLEGTTGDDTVRIWPGTPGGANHRVQINSVDSFFDASVYDAIYVDGLGGTDTLNIYGKATTENAAFNGMSVHVSEATVYDAYGQNFESIYAFGGGGADASQMLGSAGDDNLYVNENYSYLRGNGNAFLNYASAFDNISANVSGSGGSDATYAYDGVNDDVVVAGETQATIDFNATASPGVNVTAQGFGKVDVYGGNGGIDTATLNGSAGNDALTGRETYSYVSGNGGAFRNYVKDFGIIVADVSIGGGSDTAVLVDSSGNDRLDASQASVVLDFKASGPSDPNITATGFPTVSVYAMKGGDDEVYFTGSAGDDRFYGRDTYGRMKWNSAASSAYASGFDFVEANLTGSGGTDIAALYDSPGDDMLTAGDAQASLDYYAVPGPADPDMVAIDFDQTYTYATKGGNDQATLNGSVGNDRFTSKTTYGNMKGPTGTFFNYATGFNRLIGNASVGGGFDRAYLYDAATDDRLTSDPVQTMLDYDAIASPGVDVTATGFDETYTYAQNGGMDTADLTGSANVDRFSAQVAFAYLKADDDSYFNYVNSFDMVQGNAVGVGDLAFMYGSDGNDILNANATSASFALNPTAGTPVMNTAAAFDQVYSYASGGGTDTANLIGTTGDDSFIGDLDWGFLRSTGTSDYFNYVRYFDDVFADPGDTDIDNDLFDDRGVTYTLDSDPINGNDW